MRECPNPQCKSMLIYFEEWGPLGGSDADGPDMHQAYCKNCGTAGPFCNSREKAIAVWDALPRFSIVRHEFLEAYEQLKARWGLLPEIKYTAIRLFDAHRQECMELEAQICKLAGLIEAEGGVDDGG